MTATFEPQWQNEPEGPVPTVAAIFVLVIAAAYSLQLFAPFKP
jgi:hypothetical protein